MINLRAVSRGINQRNQKRHKTNKSGRTGVSFARKIGKWLANIKVDGKTIHLGFYEKIEEAISARELAERKYHFTGRE